MVRSGRVLAAAGAAARMGMGFVGISLIAAGFVGPPGLDSPAGSDPSDKARRMGRIILRVPEGEFAGHLTVADESGRELATVTLLSNDSFSVVSRLHGSGVGFWLNEDSGTAEVSTTGTPRRTYITVHRDGTTQPRAEEVLPGGRLLGDRPDSGGGGRRDVPGAVIAAPVGPEPRWAPEEK